MKIDPREPFNWPDPDKECFSCGAPLWYDSGQYWDRDDKGELTPHDCPFRIRGADEM